jgi:hypothetical protein
MSKSTLISHLLFCCNSHWHLIKQMHVRSINRGTKRYFTFLIMKDFQPFYHLGAWKICSAMKGDVLLLGPRRWKTALEFHDLNLQNYCNSGAFHFSSYFLLDILGVWHNIFQIMHYENSILPWLVFLAPTRIWVIYWWENALQNKCFDCILNMMGEIFTVDLMLLQIGISLYNNTETVFDRTRGLVIQQSECFDWLECCVKPNICITIVMHRVESQLLFRNPADITYSPQFDNVQKRKSIYTLTTST